MLWLSKILYIEGRGRIRSKHICCPPLEIVDLFGGEEGTRSSGYWAPDFFFFWYKYYHVPSFDLKSYEIFFKNGPDIFRFAFIDVNILVKEVLKNQFLLVLVKDFYF